MYWRDDGKYYVKNNDNTMVGVLVLVVEAGVM